MLNRFLDCFDFDFMRMKMKKKLQMKIFD